MANSDRIILDSRIRGNDKWMGQKARSAGDDICLSFPRKASPTMLAGIQV